MCLTIVNCNLLTTAYTLHIMSDMLKRLYDQLEAKYEELRQAEAEREVLKDEMEDAMYAVHEAAENLKNHDRIVESIQDKIQNIREDIDSLTGT